MSLVEVRVCTRCGQAAPPGESKLQLWLLTWRGTQGAPDGKGELRRGRCCHLTPLYLFS